MADLLKLAKRVEDGDVSADLALIDEIANALGVCGEGFVSDALEWQKIDGAKALHDAVLPGWIVFALEQLPELWRAALADSRNLTISKGIIVSGMAKNPAAAWVSAILRAKAGME